MSGKQSGRLEALALMVLTLIAVMAGIVLLIADYVIGAAAAVRKRLRAITRV